MNKIKVAIYARVGSPHDVNVGLEKQINTLRGFAENNNMEIIREYKEQCSGLAEELTERDRMIQDALAKEFDTIIATDFSRLGRNTLAVKDLIDKLNEEGITILLAY